MIQACFADLASYLQSEPMDFVLNLRDANVEQILVEHENYKRQLGKRSTGNGLLFNIRELGFNIKPIQVTDLFYSLFQAELVNRGLSLATIDQYCGQLAASLEWAGKHGCVLSPTYDQFIHHSGYQGKPKVALTPDEISHIYHYDINQLPCRADKRKRMDRVRDMLVLSCSLGQRYSDMRRISPDNFDDNNLRIVQQKTGNIAVVDIDKYAIDSKVVKNILKKYNYVAPVYKDIKQYNDSIHYLLKHIGGEFLDEIVQEYHDGNRVVTKRYKKYELISSHTGRRTFATNNVKRGYKDRDIMRATGHKELGSFESYLILN